MAKKKDDIKTVAVGDVVTLEVATPHYGLEKGETRTMTITPDVLFCIEAGLWRVKE